MIGLCSDYPRNYQNIGVAPRGFTRLIIEKPFGYNLQSARDLNENMSKYVLCMPGLCCNSIVS